MKQIYFARKTSQVNLYLLIQYIFLIIAMFLRSVCTTKIFFKKNII